VIFTFSIVNLYRHEKFDQNNKVMSIFLDIDSENIECVNN